MLVCLATYKDRLSVLLERASELRLFEFSKGSWHVRGFSPRPDDCPAGLARLLSGAGANLLVCGGIRAPHLQYLRGAGIEVLPWISGAVREVLEGVAGGDLSRMVMPGSVYEKPGCLVRLDTSEQRGKRSGRPKPPDGAAAGIGF